MCGIATLIEYGEGIKNIDSLIESIQYQLNARGPDHFNSICLPKNKNLNKLISIKKIEIFSSILHLRGKEMFLQPARDKEGNILVWNGEIFNGISIPHDESDTKILFQLLSKTTSIDMVLNIIQKIQGPFAFIYWQECSKTLIYGHDRFGRRSLLMEKSSNYILISSCCMNKKEKKNDLDYSSNHEKNTLQEISCKGIYSFQPFHNYEPILHEWKEEEIQEIEKEIKEKKIEKEIIKEKEKEKEIEINLKMTKKEKNLLKLPIDFLPSFVYDFPKDNSFNFSSDIIYHSMNFLIVLNEAVYHRVNYSNIYSLDNSIGILFSGGLDSVVLAALTHFHLSSFFYIELINICFDSPNFQSPDRLAAQLAYHELKIIYPQRKWKLIEINCPYHQVLAHQSQIYQLIQPCDSQMDFNIGTAFYFLSQGKGKINNYIKKKQSTSMKELNSFLFSSCNISSFFNKDEKIIKNLSCPMKNCKRKRKLKCQFNLCRYCCFQLQKGNLDMQKEYQLMIKSSISSIDFNLLSCSIHPMFKKKTLFIDEKEKEKENEQQQQQQQQEAEEEEQEIYHQEKENNELYTCKSRVLLVGIGADEQLGGYGRHKTAYERGGWEELKRECEMDMKRIWKRNLGRDDRCISFHGKESRFPYLDENVVDYLKKLPFEYKVNFHLSSSSSSSSSKTKNDDNNTRGIGDKQILRCVAQRLRLITCCGLAKRAIQFGTRIAKQTNQQNKTSNRQAKGTCKLSNFLN